MIVIISLILSVVNNLFPSMRPPLGILPDHPAGAVFWQTNTPQHSPKPGKLGLFLVARGNASLEFEARQDHFVCSTSRLKRKEVCPTHFIRAVVLEQGVLAHMRLVIACVSTHEERFRKAMGAKKKVEAKKELAAKRRQLTQAERRIEELDRLFKRIYEDNANGKLSDSRFQMLSDDYEQEQEELREKLLQLNEEVVQQEEQAENIDRFIGKVRKYLDLDKLTPAVLNDMVKAVYVHASDKSSGHREQQIDISYDLVGILPMSLLYNLQNGETA